MDYYYFYVYYYFVAAILASGTEFLTGWISFPSLNC